MAEANAKDAPKPAPPPKKLRPEEDADEKAGGEGASPLKQKFLPTGLSRAVVLAAVIASLAVLGANLFGNRFELSPAPNSTNGFMYRIDKLTGGVQFCTPQGCGEIPTGTKP